MSHDGSARELRELAAEYEQKFARIPEEMASRARGKGKWSRKEILGHLIDSAANNHQRFIRLQQEPELRFPGYEQEAWVRTNGYAECQWAELVTLWAAYNRHLAHVMERIGAESLMHVWVNGTERHELGFLAADYVAHLRHHLEQIAGAD
ncbi:MAG TPA: DinB family protein [Acidobacteriaceae bacterium]|nr:DinB family protein [Acidobacteriaceae bacterium]